MSWARRRAASGTLALLLLGLACRTEPSAGAPHATAPGAAKPGAAGPAARQPGAAQPAPPPSAPKPAAPLWRVIERTGSHEMQAVEGFAQCARSGSGGSVVLDLQGGARVRLAPNSLVCALESEPTTLFAVRGGLFSQLFPQANLEGSPELRVVTAPGSFAVTGGGELWIGQRNWLARRGEVDEVESQTYVAMLRGHADLARLEGQAAPELGAKLEPCDAPDERAFGLRLQPRSPRTPDAARAAGELALQRRQAPIRISGAENPLESLLARIPDEEQQGAALLARLPKPGSPGSSIPADEVRGYQRELAAHAQRARGLRQSLRLAAERYLLASLAACAERSAPLADCPALANWRERFQERVSGALHDR